MSIFINFTTIYLSLFCFILPKITKRHQISVYTYNVCMYVYNIIADFALISYIYRDSRILFVYHNSISIQVYSVILNDK